MDRQEYQRRQDQFHEWATAFTINAQELTQTLSDRAARIAQPDDDMARVQAAIATNPFSPCGDQAQQFATEHAIEDSVGRLGGDEFAVVCEDFEAPLDEITARVRQVPGNPYSFRAASPSWPPVSIGVAIPNRTETVDQLLERADASMYTAKAIHRS